MTVGAATVAGAVSGLVLGIFISVTTDIPLAPEAGLVLGALAGWLIRRDRGWEAGDHEGDRPRQVRLT
jgi:uncharacterized protein YqgC (DUF456 family)